MSIDDPELEKQLISLSVPKKSPLLEQNILALATAEQSAQDALKAKSVAPQLTWASFFRSIFSAPQVAMAFSVILCCGLWMGWSLPTDSTGLLIDASTIELASNGNTTSFNYDDFVSSDGIYEGDLF